MAGRPRKAKITLASIEDCTRAMGELAVAMAEEEKVQAEAALAVAQATQKFEARLDAARTQKKDLELALQNYYYGHLTELEKDDAKFVQLVNGRMGRKDNPPKLVPLNKAWTWESIAVCVRALWGAKYFHPPKEAQLDKEKIKAAKLDADVLASAGLKTEADETFYIEPIRLETEVKP